MIPFLDMKARHAPLRQEFLQAIDEIIDSGDFPVSEHGASEFLSLPMFPELTPGQIDCVLQAAKQALAGCIAA